MKGITKHRALSIISGFGWGVVHPAISVAIRALTFRNVFTFNGVLAFFIFSFFGVLGYYINGNLSFILTCASVGFISLYFKEITRERRLYDMTPVVIWFILAFILGVIFPTTAIEARYAFIGGEINFTGFHLIIFSLLLLQRRYVKYAYLCIFLAILLTLSRTAFAIGTMIILTNIYYTYGKHYRNLLIILMLSIVGFLSFIFLNFESTGYVLGLERLININDSSSAERLSLIYKSFDLIVGNLENIFFGVRSIDIGVYMENNKIVHNSFLQRAMFTGVPLLMIVIYYGFKILPVYVMFIILIYSLFLHALISPVFFIFLTGFFYKDKSIFLKNV
jgi:hypothetical protein